MTDQHNGGYTPERDHWRLVERVAIVEADMRQIGPALARIETTLAARASAAPAPQETAAALALHRALDALPKQNGGGHPILWILAMMGVAAAALVVGKFVL